MQCQALKTYMLNGRVIFLPIRSIQPNPAQPRQRFSEEGLSELAASIRVHGVLQPLSVRRVGTGFSLVTGERRLRAAALAGLNEVPCVVVQMDDREAAVAALVENLQRQDLDFVEQAVGISRLMELGNLSQEQVASQLGITQGAVANKLRVLRHSAPVLRAILAAGLTERHARALLRLPDEDAKLAAVSAMKDMTVARAENYIDSLLCAPKARPRERNVGSFLQGISRSLAKMQLSGIAAVSEQRETDSEIVVTITIAKG